MYKVGFIIEQTLGHITHGKNLQKNVSKDESVVAMWGLPAWEGGIFSKMLPIYKSNWTVRAGLQARSAVATMRRKGRLDALFFHTQVVATLSIDQIRRVPSVVSLDAAPLQYEELGEFYQHIEGPEWFERLKFRLNMNCFRAAKHLVTWSHWAKESLVADYDVNPDRVTVIPPGVNPSEWARPSQRNGNNSVVRILFVGGDLKRKGGYDLLEAFRHLREEELEGWGIKPDIQLHLVTKDQISEEPGLFVYNDMQPNSPALKQLYHDSHIFCLPTYGDCLPMVLSEAGAAGLPLVSTEVAAIPEVVRNGETGYLVPIGDVITLRAALRRLVYDPALRGKLGEGARCLVDKHHNAPQNANQLLELLKHTADVSSLQ